MRNNIDTLFTVLAFVAAGIGAYVLLTGNWATPMQDWLLMTSPEN
jgi:hypothetical protein